MDFLALVGSARDWPLSQAIGESSWWVAIDAAHVLFQGLVFGTIALVDLRLLGLGLRNASVSELSHRLLPWTWTAFVGAALTGGLLFMVRPDMYLPNPAFQLKIGLMVLAGVNMAVFHALTWRSVDQWDHGRPTPLGAKVAGFLSLGFWIGSIFFARYMWFPWAMELS